MNSPLPPPPMHTNHVCTTAHNTVSHILASTPNSTLCIATWCTAVAGASAFLIHPAHSEHAMPKHTNRFTPSLNPSSPTRMNMWRTAPPPTLHPPTLYHPPTVHHLPTLRHLPAPPGVHHLVHCRGSVLCLLLHPAHQLGGPGGLPPTIVIMSSESVTMVLVRCLYQCMIGGCLLEEVDAEQAEL